MIDHRPYPKIASRPDPASVSPGGTWVATEKVHGANLVIATDGAEVRIGKRKAWLEDGDGFFGWQLLRRDLEVAARGVHARLGGVVRIYGEIFGGAYPHDDVAPAPGAAPVQTGVWYAPDIRFLVFDVMGDDELLAHREVEALAEEAGLLAVPVLGRGTRGELERLPVRYPTRVPALLGLPPIADNLAEGLVIKPDARAPASERAVVKRKIAELDEQRFDDSAHWDPDRMIDLDGLRALATRMVNPARVASARSKLGEVADAVLRDEIVLDVLIDLEAAFPRAVQHADDEALRVHVTAAAGYAVIRSR